MIASAAKVKKQHFNQNNIESAQKTTLKAHVMKATFQLSWVAIYGNKRQMSFYLELLLKWGTTESNKTPHMPHTGTGAVSPLQATPF